MTTSARIDSDEATDRWPGLPPELLLRNWRNAAASAQSRWASCCVKSRSATPTRCSRLLSRDEIAQVIAPPPQSASDLADAHRRGARRAGSMAAASAFPCCRIATPRRSGCSACASSNAASGLPSGSSCIAPRALGRRTLLRRAPVVVDFAFDVLGVHRLEGPRGHAQRPRQRRPPEDWRRPGRRAAPVAATGAWLGRPGAVDAASPTTGGGAWDVGGCTDEVSAVRSVRARASHRRSCRSDSLPRSRADTRRGSTRCRRTRTPAAAATTWAGESSSAARRRPGM